MEVPKANKKKFEAKVSYKSFNITQFRAQHIFLGSKNIKNDRKMDNLCSWEWERGLVARGYGSKGTKKVSNSGEEWEKDQEEIFHMKAKLESA